MQKVTSQLATLSLRFAKSGFCFVSCRDFCSSFSKLRFGAVLVIPLITATLGCSRIPWPITSEECNFRTYVNTHVTEYVRSRYPSGHPVRMAIVPFEVPESFAPTWSKSGTYGRDLAHNFQSEFLRTGEFPIVELFDRDRWPGKTDDFEGGNYQSVQIAREAGYDLVMVGKLEPIKTAATLEFHSKIIDVSEGITVWDGLTSVLTHRRSDNKFLSDLHLAPNRPELFYFPERANELTVCTVNEMINGKVQP